MRCLCLVLALVLPSLVMAETLTGIASVVDGDTLVIDGQRIRLHGIDAPESAQHCYRLDRSRWPCGQAAAAALAEVIGARRVRCRGEARDDRGHLLATCAHQEQELNAWMVRHGWALAARQERLDYTDEEEQAKTVRAGLWAGAFIVPWEWPARRYGERTIQDDDEPPFGGHQGAAGRFRQY